MPSPAVVAAEAELEKTKTLVADQKIKLALQAEVIRGYGHEKAKLEARTKGFAVTEQALENGGIKLQIIEEG